MPIKEALIKAVPIEAAPIKEVLLTFVWPKMNKAKKGDKNVKEAA